MVGHPDGHCDIVFGMGGAAAAAGSAAYSHRPAQMWQGRAPSVSSFRRNHNHSSRDSPFSIASGEPVELAARGCTGFARMHLSAKSTSGWRTRHFLAQRKSSVVADSQLLFCLSPRYSAPHKGWPKGIQYRNAAAPGKQTGYCLGGVVIAAIVKPIHISVGVGIVLQALRAAAR